VSQALPEKRQNMLVIKGIEDHPSLATGPNDARIPKQPQLVRNSRFGHTELESEVADTQFRPRESIKDTHPGWIPEDAENLGQAFDSMRIER
jgi:hypothetical protein